MDPQVLLVEDDVPLRRSLALALEDEQFVVWETGTGREALTAVGDAPDAVVLDLGLPDVEGVELCGQLRSCTTSPILVHSVLRSSSDLVRTLHAGADDYLTKPFPVVDLAGHLRTLLLRPPVALDVLVRQGLDGDGVGRTTDGRTVALTSTELHLLAELITGQGAPVSRAALVHRVWGVPPVGGRAVLEARVHSLSAKLEALGGPGVLIDDDGCWLPA